MDYIKYLEEWFKDETEEAGLYMGMARQAEREGYPEIARQLRETAIQEAEHAGIAAELAGKIGKTKENLERMTEGEGEANSVRMKIAKDQEGEAKAYLIVTAKDEARHKRALEGLKERL